MPKVLVSIRLDERIVKMLSQKANELGIGLTVLIRNYVEAMIAHEKMGISKTIHIPAEEYDLILSHIAKDIVEKRKYVEFLKHIILAKLLWIYGRDYGEKVSPQLVNDVLKILKTEGRIDTYGIRDFGDRIVVKASTYSEIFAQILCEIIKSVFKNVNCKIAGKTIVALIRENEV